MTILVKGQTAAWRRLLSPFKYLAINHSVKSRFDWGWPVALTAFCMIGFSALPVQPVILGDGGFLKGVRDLIALLAAFFVAALAAVATFDRPVLDDAMEGTTPTLYGRPLSRRQFVCYLFGYLAVVSFMLFLASVFAEIVAPSFRVMFSPDVFGYLKIVAGALFALGFWNMIVTTLLGVYFLVERVNLVPASNDTTPPHNLERRSRPVGSKKAA